MLMMMIMILTTIIIMMMIMKENEKKKQNMKEKKMKDSKKKKRKNPKVKSSKKRFKKVFIQNFNTDITKEDSGQALIANIDGNDESDTGIYVRVISWDETKKHND